MEVRKLRDYTGKDLAECTILELYNTALAWVLSFAVYRIALLFI